MPMPSKSPRWCARTALSKSVQVFGVSAFGHPAGTYVERRLVPSAGTLVLLGLPFPAPANPAGAAAQELRHVLVDDGHWCRESRRAVVRAVLLVVGPMMVYLHGGSLFFCRAAECQPSRAAFCL